MVGQGYVPPAYIPLGQSDADADAEPDVAPCSTTGPSQQQQTNIAPGQWSSGICACFDDLQSCCIGFFCPCYLFAKNAEFLGSRTLFGPCMTHFIMWALGNTVCCLATEGFMLGIPGCFIACYACGYRKTIRSKYNLQEAPCGDFLTHFFCHLCAICQEYREIRERSADSNPPNLDLVEVTAPALQTMELTSTK